MKEPCTTHKKNHQIFWRKQKSSYLCIRKREAYTLVLSENLLKREDGPFVYRLGRKIFILERGVRFSHGLHKTNKIKNIFKD